jgi:hypothetical protein
MALELCLNCGLIHPSETRVEGPARIISAPRKRTNCETALLATLKTLMLRVGRHERCRFCPQMIFWLTFGNGDRRPYDEIGQPHRCGQAPTKQDEPKEITQLSLENL